MRIEVSCRAFSLLEMIITLTIVLILLSIISPSLQNLQQKNSLTTSLERLISAIELTRNAAIRQNSPTVLCGSTNHRTCDGGWNAGQIVTDEITGKIFQIYGPLPWHYTLKWRSTLGKNNTLQFESNGFSGQMGRFQITDHNHSTVSLIVSRSGRVRVEKN